MVRVKSSIPRTRLSSQLAFNMLNLFMDATSVRPVYAQFIKALWICAVFLRNQMCARSLTDVREENSIVEQENSHRCWRTTYVRKPIPSRAPFCLLSPTQFRRIGISLSVSFRPTSQTGQNVNSSPTLLPTSVLDAISEPHSALGGASLGNVDASVFSTILSLSEKIDKAPRVIEGLQTSRARLPRKIIAGGPFPQLVVNTGVVAIVGLLSVALI